MGSARHKVQASKLKTADARLVNATYGEFKRLMSMDPEPLRAGAENAIENLQAIGISIPNKNLEDYLDTEIVQALKKEGFLPELARKCKIQYTHDRQFGVSFSGIRTLPYQIEAVHQAMLPQPRLGFLLADDPGAGKTIMAF